MPCVNLREQFGDRYRIGYDPARRPRESLDPWSMVLLCRYGEIYPYGGTRLVVEVEGHPKVKRRLARLSCCEVHQDGDFGFGAFRFDVDDFEQVARIVRPRRRRRQSEKQRWETAERLRKYWFQSRTSEQLREPETADAEGTR